MLTNGQITGIDPFAAQSTFICDGLSIPRGMFYGGCFYTAQDFTAPVHISYIAPNGIWGVADASSKELAEIHFTAGSPVGHIIGTDGQYSGCLKARVYNYCDTAVADGGDLEIFLRSIVRKYELNQDTLVFDICRCTALERYETESPNVAAIQLPEDCVLVPDSFGNYYMSAISAPVQPTDALQRLTISGGGASCVLSGSHISILPWCEVATAVGAPVSGSVYESAGTPKGVQDITVSVVDGAIVIATLGSYTEIDE